MCTVSGTHRLRARAEVVVLVADVDDVAAELRERSVALLAGPVDRPWGHRTLHVADPDGFIVEFAQEIQRTRSRRGFD